MSMVGNLLRVEKDELEAYSKDSTALEKRIDVSMDSENYLDIGKSWEGIFYMLTGYGTADMEKAQPPLSRSLFSGQLIDSQQDLGYGPAHYCTPEQVHEVSTALKNISTPDFQKRFKAEEMTSLGIYPETWNQEKEGALEFLIENFEKIKDFYSKADEEEQAVITFIS